MTKITYNPLLLTEGNRPAEELAWAAQVHPVDFWHAWWTACSAPPCPSAAPCTAPSTAPCTAPCAAPCTAPAVLPPTPPQTPPRQRSLPPRECKARARDLQQDPEEPKRKPGRKQRRAPAARRNTTAEDMLRALRIRARINRRNRKERYEDMIERCNALEVENEELCRQIAEHRLFIEEAVEKLRAERASPQ